MNLPQNVKDAVERMCTPLDKSRLSGATAECDARCMETIHAHLISQEAEIGRLRGSNKRLHRRCQEAEAALPDYRKITALPPNGDGVRFAQGSMGRILLSVLCDVLAGERDVAQSRLVAANALLEIIRTGHDGKKYDYVEARDGHMVLVAPHLQGAGDE